MKRYAIKLTERNGMYIVPCGSNAVMPIDGRLSVVNAAKLAAEKFDDFVVVRLPNLRGAWLRNIETKRVGSKSLPLEAI